MTLRNPRLFGLNVLSYLADVEDKNRALTSLNLPPLDMEVISGSSETATRQDWISLSRLNSPIYKSLDRYLQESSTYIGVLDSKAGTDRTLFGGLIINGGLSGNAIRYRYVDGAGSGATVKIADISTSRVSSWSSSASPVLSTSPISYGARVGIITGGQLQFGTPSSPSQVRLQTTLVPEAKEFASEFPTSKITCTIGGSSVTLYAMKGIPLVLTGFFRNLDATIRLTSLINNTPASWKIVDVGNENSYTNFANAGTSIRYRSSRSKERYIKYYYNPDNISEITINSANITQLPPVKLVNALTFNFANNNLQNFPDLTFISPNLTRLFLQGNPFYLSETENERKLRSTVTNKIPTTLRELYLGGTFFGSITQNIIASRFTNLEVLNLSAQSGRSFHPDSDDSSNQLPNVSSSCEVYNVNYNDFRSFGTTNSGSDQYNIQDLPNLTNLQTYGNYYLTDGSFSIISQDINYVNIGNCGLPCPNLSNRQELQSYYQHYSRNVGSIFDSGTYKFDGCPKLSTLYFYASPLTGAMPKFTNPELSYLELRYTRLTGGSPDGNTSYVIPQNTFEQCSKLSYMLLQSGNLLTSPIHPDAFANTTNLYYLWYVSYGRTTGPIPNLSTNSRLTYLYLYYNRFTGTLPTFASNPSIYYVQVAYNQLSGNIPGFRNLSNLYYLFLYNNRFTGLSRFQNLPRLTYFYAHNNQMTGDIPDFSECPRLYYLILFNNQFTNYTSGSFSQLYRIRYLDLSNNQLTQQAVNSIISDLYDNYTTVNRSSVTINLRGNSLPSGQDILDKVDFLRSKGWSLVYE